MRGVTCYLAVLACFLAPCFAARAAAEEPLDAMVLRLVGEMAVGKFRDHKFEDWDYVHSILGGYARNEAQIIGIGRAALPGLLKALESPRTPVVFAAADCVLVLGDDASRASAVKALGRILPTLKDEDLRICLFLHAAFTHKLPLRLDAEQLGGQESAGRLLRWLEYAGVPDIEPQVLPLLSHERSFVRCAAAEYLAQHGSEAALPLALALVDKEKNWATMGALATIVGKFGAAEQARPVLGRVLRCRGSDLQLMALPGIERLKLDDLVPLVEGVPAGLGEKELHWMNGRVVPALCAMGTPAALAQLKKWSEHPWPRLREYVASDLWRLGNDGAVEILEQLSDDDVITVRDGALSSLLRMCRKVPAAAVAMDRVGSRRVQTNREPAYLVAGLLVRSEFEKAAAFTREHTDSYLKAVVEALHMLGVDDRRIGEFLASWCDEDLKRHRERLPIADDVLWLLQTMEFLNTWQPIHEYHKRLPRHREAYEMGAEGAPTWPGSAKTVDKFRESLPDDEDKVLQYLQSPDLVERVAAAERLFEIGSAKSIGALESAAAEPIFFSPRMRNYSAIGCFWRGKPVAEEEFALRLAARKAIERIKGKK